MAPAVAFRFLITSRLLIGPLILLLFITVETTSETPSQLPFLDADDPETVCAMAVRYMSPHRSPPKESRPGDDPLPAPRLASPDDADDGGSPAEMRSSSPIIISVNSSIYSPRQALKVTVSSPIAFRGLVIHARRLGQTSVVGQFIISSDDNFDSASRTKSIRAVNCDGTEDTLVTWRDASYLSQNETYLWIPPEEDVGAVQFIATVFQDISHYWTNVTSGILRKGFVPIDLSSCGKKKGCFRYTSADKATCDAHSCIYALSYHVTDNTAHFELTAAADWVAVGFSSDDKMGGDDVFLCSRTRVGLDPVRNYFTDVGYMPPTLKTENPLFNAEFEALTSPAHGQPGDPVEFRVSCRFSRPLKVMFDQWSVDLSNTWYQLYAWGSVTMSGDTINKHALEKPPTSTQKLTLRVSRNDVISGSQLHACSERSYLVIALLTILFSSVRCRNEC